MAHGLLARKHNKPLECLFGGSMQVGSIVRRSNAENPKWIGMTGIATKEYKNGEDETVFIVLWSNGVVGRGWRHDSWGLEVLCE